MVARQVIAIVALACATSVSADDKPADNVLQAKELLRQGANHAQSGEYHRALVAFLEAHRLWSEPFIYFNIAEAYRLSGDPQSALKYYKDFLRALPTHAKAEAAKNWIVKLSLEIDEKSPAPASKSAPPDLAPTPVEPVKPAPVEPVPAVAAPVASPAPQPTPVAPPIVHDTPPDRDPSGRTLRYAGIGVASAGLVSLIVGIKFGLDARAIEDELHSDRPWTDRELAGLQARVDEGNRAETKCYVLTGLGGAAIVAGAVMYVVGRDTSRKRTTATHVVPSGTGLAFVGTF